MSVRFVIFVTGPLFLAFCSKEVIQEPEVTQKTGNQSDEIDVKTEQVETENQQIITTKDESIVIPGPDKSSKFVLEESPLERAYFSPEDISLEFSRHCYRCHSWAPDQEAILEKKAAIIAEISEGSMPPNNADWMASEAGQNVIQWLQSF